MICKNCNNFIDDNSKICPFCSYEITDEDREEHIEEQQKNEDEINSEDNEPLLSNGIENENDYVNEQEEERRRKNRIAFTIVTVILLLIVSIGAITSVIVYQRYSQGKKQNVNYVYDEEKFNSKIFVTDIFSTPSTIDPSLAYTMDTKMIVDSMFEGLIKLDGTGNPIVGVIENMPEVSQDGLTYTFKIRSNAKWSDGKDLTSKDFKFSFIRGLTKNTEAESFYQLFVIKNGENFYNGTVNSNEVGIETPDDKTLIIHLEYPAPYFLQLLSNSIFYPLREDAVNNDNWSLNPDTYISNGPFKLKEYSYEGIITEKNQNYYDEKNVYLNGVEFKVYDDSSGAFAAFLNGEIDFTTGNANKELASKGLVKGVPYAGTEFLDINLNSKSESSEVLKDVKVRKALSLSINRYELFDDENYNPAVMAIVPYGILDDNGQNFTNKSHGSPYDLEEARKLLSEAGFPNGEGFPKLTYLYNSAESNQRFAEYLQTMWKQDLGIDIEFKSLDWDSYMEEKRNGNYDIARDSWISDYLDPNTFLELFVSNQNVMGYSNPDYDNKLKDAKYETDSHKRFEFLKEAEGILMDDMPVIPINFYGNILNIQPYVKGLEMAPNGAIDFKPVYFEK